MHANLRAICNGITGRLGEDSKSYVRGVDIKARPSSKPNKSQELLLVQIIDETSVMSAPGLTINRKHRRNKDLDIQLDTLKAYHL